jgi:hypothetical protein
LNGVPSKKLSLRKSFGLRKSSSAFYSSRLPLALPKTILKTYSISETRTHVNVVPNHSRAAKIALDPVRL